MPGIRSTIVVATSEKLITPFILNKFIEYTFAIRIIFQLKLLEIDRNVKSIFLGERKTFVAI